MAIKVVTRLTRAAEIQYSITDLSRSPFCHRVMSLRSGSLLFFFNSTGGAIPSSIMTPLVSLSPLSTSTKCQWASATFLHPNLGAAAAFSEHFFFYFSISAETASCFTPRSGFPRLQSLRYSEEIHVGRNLMPPVSCFLPESAALFTVSLPALFI